MMMKFIRVVFLLILICCGFGVGINNMMAQVVKCGTEEAMQAQFKMYPDAKIRMEAFEQSLKKIKTDALARILHEKGAQSDDACSQQLYVIPVVFHVFYGESAADAAQLVPMSQLQSALDIANEDFNMTNTALINTIDPLFAPVVKNMRVKFVLAKKDPQGNPTAGATFHPERRFFGDNTYEIEDSVKKYAWDNYKYCNVYVMNYLHKNNNAKPSISYKVISEVTDPETKKVITGDNSLKFLSIGENYFYGGAVGLNVTTPKIDLRTVTNPELSFSDNLSWDYSYPSNRPDDLGTVVMVSESMAGPWTKVAVLSTNKSSLNKWIPRTIDLTAFAGKEVFIRFNRNKHHYYYAIDNFGVKAAGASTFAFNETFEAAAVGALPAGWISDVTDYNADPNNSGVAWYPDKGMNDRNVSRIVFNGWYLGMGGISLNNRSFNSTFSHELGHWLNLKHTFDGYNCSGPGDEVDDTPPTNKSGAGCAASVCGGKINAENFMDYNTTCYKMFTKGQVDRMTAAMAHTARKSIWSLSNLEATGVVAAYDNTCAPQGLFYMSAEKVLAGNNSVVNFEDQSVHFPTAWEWTIDNGSGTPVKSYTRTAAAAFDKEGSYTIELKVKNANGETVITRTLVVTQKEEGNCKGGDDFNTTPIGNIPASWTSEIPSGNFAVAKVSKDEYVDLDGPYATIKSADNSTYLYLSENFNTELNSADIISITSDKYSLAGLTNPAVYFSDNLAWDRSWPSARPVDEATTIFASESLTGPWVSVGILSTDKSNMGKWNTRKLKLTQFAGKDIYLRIQRAAHHFFYAFEDLCIKEWDGGNTPDPEPEPSMGADCKAGENFNKMTAGSQPAGWIAGIPQGSKANYKVSATESVNLDGAAGTVKAADNSTFLFMGENFNDELNNWDELTITSTKMSLKNVTKATLSFSDNLAWDAFWPADRPEDNATLVQVSENGTSGWTTVATLNTNKSKFGKWNARSIDIKAYDGKDIYLRIVRNEHHYYYAIDDICIKEGGNTNPNPDPDPSMGEGCKAGENFNKMTAGSKPAGWNLDLPAGSKSGLKITTSENVDIDGLKTSIKSADQSNYLFVGENFNDDLNGPDQLNLVSSKFSLKNVKNASLTFSDNLGWDPSWPDPRPDDEATTVSVSESQSGGWVEVGKLSTNQSQFGKWNNRSISIKAFDGKDIYVKISRNAHHYYYALEDVCISGEEDGNPNPGTGNKDCKAGEDFNKMTDGVQPAGWEAKIPDGNKAALKASKSENVDIDGFKTTIKSADQSLYLFVGENFNDVSEGPEEITITSPKISLKALKEVTLHFSDNLGWDPAWPEPRPDDNATTILVSESAAGPFVELVTLSTNKSKFGLWNDRSADFSKYDGKEIYLRFRRNAHHFYYAVENICFKGKPATGNPDPEPRPDPEQPPLGKGEAFSLMITPNPVFTDLRVTFLNRIPGGVNMEIIDMSGRVIMRKSLQSKGEKSETHVWPVSNLAPGVYLLRINNGALKESQRFIKF